MTKAQATAMNERFISLTTKTKELESRVATTDSLLTHEHAIALENLMGFGWALDSIKDLKYQLSISQGALFIQTEKVSALEKQLKRKPEYQAMTSSDIWMGSVFTIFGTILTAYYITK